MSRARLVSAILFSLSVLVLGPVPSALGRVDGTVRIDPTGLRSSFVPNVGQADPSVLFEGGVIGRSVSLTADGVVFSDGQRLVFDGAKGAMRVHPVGRLPGVANFFLGQDPERWRTAVPTFAAVRYEDLYEGVDALFAFSGDQLVGEFQAMSPDRLASVGWRTVGGAGSAPPAAAVSAGVLGGGDTVRLVLRPEGAVGLEPLATVPEARIGQVTIDFASVMGGGREDSASAVAVDDVGNVYVAGSTQSSNFPLANPFQDANASGSRSDAFVAKIGADGSTLVFSTYLGGNREDYARDIAVDDAGLVHVVGYTSSRDFPTAAPIQAAYGGGDTDGWVVAFSPDGSQLQFGSFLGGRDADNAQGLALGRSGPAAGQLFVAGSTVSSDFPTKNAYQAQRGGGEEAFLTLIAPDRKDYLYSTYLGGPSTDSASAVAVDETGSAYVAGYTESARFPTMNPLQQNLRGDFDGFVTQFSPAGAAAPTVLFSTFLGGLGLDEALAVDVWNGNITVVGYTESSNFPTKSAVQPQLKGDGDGFVTRILADRSDFSFSTFLGGTAVDRLYDVVVDPLGVAHVAGSSESPNFPTVNPVQSRLSGPYDAVVASLTGERQTLLFGTYFGGSRFDYAYGIARDPQGRLVIVGYTESSDLPTAGGLPGGVYAGQGDAFVARFTAGGDLPTPTTTSGPPSPTSTEPADFTPTPTVTIGPTTTMPPSVTPTPTESPPPTEPNTPTATATETPVPLPTIYLPYVRKP